jgi:uncharacterized protein YjbJ (UPF0337 family)
MGGDRHGPRAEARAARPARSRQRTTPAPSSIGAGAATGDGFASREARRSERHGKRRKTNMDKDRVIGSAKVVKGKVKAAVGKAVGDSKLEAEGEADKIEGTAQNAVGGAKDAIRDA